MLRNLLANACAAGAAHIHVKAVTSPDTQMLLVDDDGVGLDAQRGYARGSGVGLNLIRRLAGRFGGTIELVSGPRGGTRAILVFSGDRYMISVLLVDDHALFRAGLRSRLERETDIVPVGEAGTAEQAVVKARALQPDLVVLDRLLPRKSGAEGDPGDREGLARLEGDRRLVPDGAQLGARGSPREPPATVRSAPPTASS